MKKYLKQYIFDLAAIFILVLCISFTYNQLTHTFYQQDEWATLGHTLVEGSAHPLAGLSLVQIILGEGRVGAKVLNLLLINSVPFSSVPSAIFSIIFHSINAVLIYFLIRSLIKNKAVAFISTLVFAVNFLSYQTVAWASSAATLPALTFLLIAVFLYIRYLMTVRYMYIVLSFISLLISLSFKETALVLFVLFPVLYVLGRKKSTLKSFFLDNSYILLYGMVFLGFRYVELHSHTVKTANIVIGGSSSFGQTILTHAFIYPLTSLSQLIMPTHFLIATSQWVAKLEYPFLQGSTGDLVSQTVVLDLVSAFFSFLLFVAILLMSIFSQYRKQIWLTLLFIFLSFLPYVVLSRGYSFFDGRYYYMGYAGYAVLIGLVLQTTVKRKWFLITAAVVIWIMGTTFSQIKYVRATIRDEVKIASERKVLVNTFLQKSSQLHHTNVFYITGNSSYLVDTTHIPFQQGIGYTLMTIYYKTGNIPSDFLENWFLWDIGTQGYKEKNGYGFGYYGDSMSMIKDLHQKKFSINDIYAYFYDGKTQKLTEITNKVRLQLQEKNENQ